MTETEHSKPSTKTTSGSISRTSKASRTSKSSGSRRKTVKEEPRQFSNFYDLERIRKENADYNLIVGERGNGKTYAVQKMLLENFLKDGSQCFLLRRWIEDTKDKNAVNFWDGNLMASLPEMSGSRFSTIVLRSGRYFLTSFDEKGKPMLSEENIIGYVWNVNESERLKGQSFPKVTDIVYEEFISLSKDGYISNEPTLFLNVVSTIVRDRTNVKIWMLGNTVNPYNPYFTLFGIKGLELKQGSIWTCSDETTGCKVAVEMCAKRRKGSLVGTSAKYFAFNSNGSSDMIIGGKWQIPDYPTIKLPQHAKILMEIGVLFDSRAMVLQLVKVDRDSIFCYVKTVKNESSLNGLRAVLDLEQNVNNRYYTAIEFLPESELKLKILDCMNNSKIYYKDKMTGCYFTNFLTQSVKNRILS